MVTTTLAPDAIISSTNLTGAVTDIDEPVYSANPVVFDGTNDYLSRGAGLTGAADSKLWCGSFWFKRAVISTTQNVFAGGTPGSTEAKIIFSSASNGVLFSAFLVGTQLNVRSSAITDTTSWHHCAFSFDLSDTAKRHIYIDDVSDLNTVTTYNNATLDFTLGEWLVGARPVNLDQFLNAELADLQIWLGSYVDLSVEANRRLFIRADGTPEAPAIAAASALGTPIVLQTGPTSAWHTNQGGGGGFTEIGALTDGAGPVEL